MQKLFAWLKWLDENILHLFLVGFVFFIPLYFKLPAIQINYTYIHVRLDDFYSLTFALVFVLQWLRKKVKLNTALLPWFLLFWGVVFLSFLVRVHGIFVDKFIQYLALEGFIEGAKHMFSDIVHDGQVKLSLLHSLRRVEYMIFFFVAASIVRSKKEFFWYIKLILLCMLIVSIYALGQKFMGWPAVQTTNPEYSKGYVLTLESYARASSTFAGHYDLAAYLVFLFPTLIGAFLMAQKDNFHLSFIPFWKKHRKQITMISLGILYFLSLFTLILTAARASYMAYFGVIVPLLLLFKRPKLLVILIVITLMMTPLSDSLKKRFQMAFTSTSVLYNPDTGTYIEPREIKIGDDNAVGSTAVTKFIPIDESKLNTQEKAKLEKEREMRKKTTIDNIYRDATLSGKAYTPEELQAEIQRRLNGYVEMQTSVVDVSISVRVQQIWPNALLYHFWQNPILGTGPASAGEGLDGDYIRWLAETGLLGTGIWLIIIGSLMYLGWRSSCDLALNKKLILVGIGVAVILAGVSAFVLKSNPEVIKNLVNISPEQVNPAATLLLIVASGILIGSAAYVKTAWILDRLGWKKLLPKKLEQPDFVDQPIYLGFFFGIVALMINAIFFDIFESSKVAYTFWMFSGMVVGSITPLQHRKEVKNFVDSRNPVQIGIIAGALVMILNMILALPPMLVRSMPNNLAPLLCPVMTKKTPEGAVNQYLNLTHEGRYDDAKEFIEYPVRSKIKNVDFSFSAEDRINPFGRVFKKLLPSYSQVHADLMVNQPRKIDGFETKVKMISGNLAEVTYILKYENRPELVTSTLRLTREGCNWVILVK